MVEKAERSGRWLVGEDGLLHWRASDGWRACGVEVYGGPMDGKKRRFHTLCMRPALMFGTPELCAFIRARAVYAL